MDLGAHFEEFCDPPANGVAIAIHARATAGAAAALGALVTTPTIVSPNGRIRYPRAVILENEDASANVVYYTVDGSTPSATNGRQIAKGEHFFLHCPQLISNVGNGAVSTTNPQIALYSAGASVQVQWVF